MPGFVKNPERTLNPSSGTLNTRNSNYLMDNEDTYHDIPKKVEK